MKDWLRGAIEHATKLGASYADIRLLNLVTENIQVKNGTVEAITSRETMGFGIRVIANGSWGFASSSLVNEGEMRRIADLAVQIAKASSTLKKDDVVLAETEIYQDKYVTPIKKDPFAVPLKGKLAILIEADKILRANKGVKIAETNMRFFRTEKTFISSDGADIDQVIYESGGGIAATAIDGDQMQVRSFPNSFRGNYGTAGYEYVEDLDLVGHAPRVAEEAVALLTAKECPSKTTTLIIGGSQLALQVHESCGHPIELDRVFGMEASYAGTSFMTPDKLNKLQYGSKIVNINADATTPGGLGTFGYDDEGVKAQRTPIIKEGLFVGYLTSRETAIKLCQKSNGTSRADGWWNIPLIRMINVNLEPGDWEFDDMIKDTDEGIYVETNKSWSIDDKRLNFHFGCEIGWEIKNGKLGDIVKNPAYTGITPEFWNSCDAICNKNHWIVWGTPNCGKGEPSQTAHVAHGTAPSRFRNVKVGVSK
ncbi:MAG: TldD/PmbA family protein [Candidatus Coatesbacteria bacterium]|nr:TldD/PmbA family protein [Candidatus Coatesbacteria bacterium]